MASLSTARAPRPVSWRSPRPGVMPDGLAQHKLNRLLELRAVIDALRCEREAQDPLLAWVSGAEAEPAIPDPMMACIRLIGASSACDNARPALSQVAFTRHDAPPLRVLIAEDNDDLRELLVTLISAEPDLKCVGTASDVEAVIASTTEHQADVLVLDLELQGRSSIDLLRTVRSNGSKITIVVFSGHSHPEMIRHTLAAGADAYVPKSGDYELLLDAIRDKRATSHET